MLCPRCGEEKESFAGKICVDCFLEGRELLRLSEEPELAVCVSCGALDVNGWKELGIEDAATMLVESSVETPEELGGVVTQFRVEEVGPDFVSGTLTMEGEVGGRRVAAERSVDVGLRRDICRRCSRTSRGYYEAILQVRGEERELGEEDLEIVLEEAGRLAEATTGEKPFFSKAEEVKGGFDIYLGDSQAAKRLAHRLKERSGAETTQSASLVGMKDGREMHRPTYLVRFPPFRSGDVVRFRGRNYLVRSLGGRAELVDLESGVSDYVPVKKLGDDGERVGDMEGLDEAVLTMVERDVVQVLDPDTLKAVTLRRPQFVDPEDQGDTVPVLEIGGELVLVNPGVAG